MQLFLHYITQRSVVKIALILFINGSEQSLQIRGMKSHTQIIKPSFKFLQSYLPVLEIKKLKLTLLESKKRNVSDILVNR